MRFLSIYKTAETGLPPTVEEMAKATGWQNHSVLGAISGVLRKRLGLTVASEREERGRVYRITGRR